MDDAERALWDGRPGTAPRLAELYWPLCLRIAGKEARRWGGSRLAEDLAGFGAIGLMQAIGSFDLSRGIRPGSHLGIRIRGAILDGIRTDQMVTVGQVRHRERGEKSVRVACSGVGAGREGRQRANPIATAAAPEDGERWDAAELERVVRKLVPGCHGDVLARSYVRGETLRTIAESQGYTETNASRIRTLAEERLRERRRELAEAWGLQP